MIRAEYGVKLRGIQEDKKTIDAVVAHYRAEHASGDEFAFLLEDK